MRAGKLRHQITLLNKLASKGAAGGERITWSAHETLMAQVTPLRSKELLAVKQGQIEADIRVNMRFHPDVTEVMRVEWQGKHYDITSMANAGGRDREIELLCSEVRSG